MEFITGLLVGSAIGAVSGWLAYRKWGPTAEQIRTSIDKNLGAK